MQKIVLILLITSISLFSKEADMSIYDFKVTTIYEKEISMNIYKNKVLLIVNTASLCGFTPQYEDLEKLYKKYKDNDFKILAFPSNQFSNQEPKNNNEIKEFCTNNYNISFDMFSKIDVNGDNAIDLYKYLKNEQSGFLWTKSIKWNFTKFLVDKKGNVVNRYAPFTKPFDIENDIKNLL